MAIPFKITGAGNNNAANVFRVTFSTALSSAPKIEAWDNSATFPSKDAAGVTTLKEIFTGTAGNSYKPMLYAVSTSSGTPGANWKPATATVGGATANRLLGTTNFVLDTAIPGAGGHMLFNLGIEVPFDATVPSVTSMAHLIQIRYTYTGSAPSVVFAANEGTEGTPVWTNFTPGSHGVQYCNASTIWASGPYKLTLPEIGTVDASELGITA